MTDTLTVQTPPEASYDIAEVAFKTGLTAHTLRYYERAGLVRDPRRDSAGRRRYTDGEVNWLLFLTRLRSTGMPIRVVREYVELCWAGAGNEAERLVILQAHREVVRARLAVAERDLGHIDYKIDLYRKGSS